MVFRSEDRTWNSLLAYSLRDTVNSRLSIDASITLYSAAGWAHTRASVLVKLERPPRHRKCLSQKKCPLLNSPNFQLHRSQTPYYDTPYYDYKRYGAKPHECLFLPRSDSRPTIQLKIRPYVWNWLITITWFYYWTPITAYYIVL